jgi:hypothetical protein
MARSAPEKVLGMKYARADVDDFDLGRFCVRVTYRDVARAAAQAVPTFSGKPDNIARFGRFRILSSATGRQEWRHLPATGV